MNSLQGTPVNRSRRLQWDAKFLGSSLEWLCMWILFTGYCRKMPGFFYVLQDFVKMVSPLICISHSLKVKIEFLLANYTRHNFCVLHAILDMHVISVNRIFYDVKEKIYDNLNHCKNNWQYRCTINLWTPSEVKRHLLTSCSEKQEDIYCLFPLLRIYKICKKNTG